MSAPLPLFTGLHIGGRWRRGSGQLDVLDPTTGAVLAGAATASVDECVEAVEAAAAAQPGWAATSPRQRAAVLDECCALLTREREVVADLIQAENGKARNEARAEVHRAAELFRWFAEEAPRMAGTFRGVPSGDERVLVMTEPVGVSLLVTPSSFPAAVATGKLAPALAAGCACVLKPAPEAPLTSLYLADLISRAGAPAGVVNVVLPEPAGEAVATLLAHPAVRHLSFTGSADVGSRLLAEAAPHAVRTSIETGGNPPFLVLDDADLDVAVGSALVAKMRDGGASCVAANRFYVAAGLYERFVGALAGRVKALTVGYDREPDADVGALVSAAERDRVAAAVTALVGSGGRVEAGGPPDDHPGFFHPPTVVADVPIDAAALRSEIFGPVAPVVACADEEAMVAAANDTASGPIAYVMGRDVVRALAVGRRLDAGVVAVNRGATVHGGGEGVGGFLRRKAYGVDL